MSLLTDYINELESNLNELGLYLVQELRNELDNQNKKASGKLIDSIEYVVKRFVGGLELQIKYLKYGRYVETGVDAKDIKNPFAPARIRALVNWIKLKRLTSGLDKEITSFAYAIANKHAKYGMPTPNAAKYSFNGRNTKFQSFVLSNNQDEIEDKLSSGINETISGTLEDIINKIQTSFGNE